MGWQPARQAQERGKPERPVSAREPRVREKSNDGWYVSRPKPTQPRAPPGPDARWAWDDSTKSSPPKSRGGGSGRCSPRGGTTGWEAARSPERASSPLKAASGARFATDDALARAGLARPGSATVDGVPGRRPDESFDYQERARVRRVRPEDGTDGVGVKPG